MISIKLIERFQEPLYEMATIGVDYELRVQVEVNQDDKSRGDPYFKVISPIKQNPKIARLAFKEPKVIHHRDKYPPLDVTNKVIKQVHKFMELPYKINPKYTRWQATKFFWNLEAKIIDDNIEAYVNGKYDDKYKSHPSYVPSTQKIPEYWK